MCKAQVNSHHKNFSVTMQKIYLFRHAYIDVLVRARRDQM